MCSLIFYIEKHLFLIKWPPLMKVNFSGFHFFLTLGLYIDYFLPSLELSVSSHNYISPTCKPITLSPTVIRENALTFLDYTFSFISLLSFNVPNILLKCFSKSPTLYMLPNTKPTLCALVIQLSDVLEANPPYPGSLFGSSCSF